MNVGVPDDRRIQFRIGINLGDVIVDEEDILGDGVNIAESFGGLEGKINIGEQLGKQALSVLVTVVWCGAFSFLFLFVIDKVIGLRVTEEVEAQSYFS